MVVREEINGTQPSLLLLSTSLPFIALVPQNICCEKGPLQYLLLLMQRPSELVWFWVRPPQQSIVSKLALLKKTLSTQKC